MKPIDDFDSWYQEALGPELDRLERKRRTTRITIGVAWLGIWGLTLVPFFVFKMNFVAWLLAIGITVAPVLMVYVYFYLMKDLRQDYKNTVIRKLVAHLDPSLDYQGAGSLQQQSFVESHLFPGPISAYRGEDLVWGEIKGTPFGACELRVRRSAGDSSRTVFAGFFFEIGLTHAVEDRVVVAPRESAEKLFGLKLARDFEREQDPEVTVEHPEFMRHFRIYSVSKVAAREALQPELCDHLLKLRGKKGQRVHLSLVGDKAYMALPREGDMFEPTLNSTLRDPKVVKSYLSALRLVTSIPARLSLTRDGGVA